MIGFLTAAALKRRGWTLSDIRRFLGTPDKIAKNPRYASASPMRLYLESRVINAEASPEFTSRAAERAKKKEAAARGVETKRTQAAERVQELVKQLRIQPLPDYKRLRAQAVSAVLARENNRGNFEASPENAPEQVVQRWVRNYVRHEMSNYDCLLEEIRGQVGVGDSYAKIRREFDAAINQALSEV